MAAPESFEFFDTERFKFLRCLGEGGMGVVYEALDRESQSRVALKTLRSLSGDALLRFKNEFRVLQDMEHPNLVTLGELVEERGLWFFTMELVSGSDFISYIRPSEPASPSSGIDSTDLALTPVSEEMAEAKTPEMVEIPQPPASGEYDEERLRSAMNQLASVINALHEQGKVHRDIKPPNVLVDEVGRVVLLDLGLVTGVAPVDQSLSIHVVGTAEYMAPEQAASKPVGPEADWYAVGVMLFQALTGRVPLTGPPLMVMVNKQKFDPPPPRALVPKVPPDLDALCVELLRFDPRARPSGSEILVRLGVHKDRLPTRSSTTSTRSRLFVGRQEELDALHESFADTRQGAAVVALVQGESGVGKSMLVSRFIQQLREDQPDVVTLVGRCYEREAVPYKAVDGVVDALSRHMRKLPDMEAAALLPREAALLVDVFPVLRRVKAMAKAPRTHAESKIDPQQLRTRLFNAMRELILRLADRRTLVIVIDDLQWADADSLALISEVLRPPDEPAVLAIATQRTGTEMAQVPGSPAVALDLSGDVRRISLERLLPEDAQELAARLLGRTSKDLHVSAEAIASEAKGHPLFIHELVRHTESHGGHGQAVLRLDEVLWERVTELPPATREVLELVAVAGRPIAQEAVALASNMASMDFQRALAVLRVGNLVKTAGPHARDVIHFYHDRVREALVAHMDEEAVQACHRELALALETLGSTESKVLAVHWRGAGDNPRAAGYTIKAADDAEQALAFDHAAQLYKVALTLRPADHKSSRSLRIKLAEALANAGRGTEAGDVYLQAADDATPAEALDLQRLAAEQFLRNGQVEKGMAAIHKFLAVVGTKLPKTRRGALASLIYRRALIRLRGLRYKERHASQVPQDELARIDTFWSVASTLGVLDNIRGGDFNGRTLLLALKAGEPNRLIGALAIETIYSSLNNEGSRHRRDKLLGMMTDLASRTEEPSALAWILAATGASDYMYDGRFQSTLETCQQAKVIWRDQCTGVAWELAMIRLFELFALFYLGKIGDFSRRVPQFLGEAMDRGDLYTATNLRLGQLNLAWLAGDDTDRALALVQESCKWWMKEGLQYHHWYMQAQGQIGLYLGKGREVFALLNEHWPKLEQSMNLRIQLVRVEAYFLRARGAIAAAAESGEGREDLLRFAAKDAKRIEKEKMAMAAPMGDLVRSGIAASRGDLEQTVALLDTAIAGFDAADMSLHASVARRRKGDIIGGDEGKDLLSASDAWMEEEKISNPGRWAAMLSPGFSGPRSSR